MARVMVSAYSNVTWTVTPFHDSFVEGFIMALERCGNQVLAFRNNDLVAHQYNHELREDVDYSAILSAIKTFDPDLILSFNNSMPHPEVITITNCPIVVYASDAPCYFLNKSAIQAHQDRYYFLHSAIQMTESLKVEFPFIDHKAIIEFGYATELRAQDIPQTNDLTFIGSIGNYSMGLPNYFANPLADIPGLEDTQDHKLQNEVKDAFFEALDRFESNSMNDFDFEFPRPDKISKSIEATMVHILTCQKRFEILSALTDLNLKIYGYPRSWARTLTYNHELFQCFDYQLNVSLEHLTRTYNGSKVAMNLPHGFTTDGFSWRVCDILASNAVLLSPRKKDLARILEGYVDLPQFETKAEARDLSIRLLAEPSWRKDLTQASQAAMDARCRFDDKIEHMAYEIGDLVLVKDHQGSVHHVDPAEYLVTP